MDFIEIIENYKKIIEVIGRKSFHQKKKKMSERKIINVKKSEVFLRDIERNYRSE